MQWMHALEDVLQPDEVGVPPMDRDQRAGEQVRGHGVDGEGGHSADGDGVAYLNHSRSSRRRGH